MIYTSGVNTPGQNKLGVWDVLIGAFAGFNLDLEDKNTSHYLWEQGVGLIITFLVSLRLFVKKDKIASIRFGDYCLIIGIILLIATTKLTPWGRFPFTLLKLIQFPWRLFEFVTFFFSIAGAYYVLSLINTTKKKLLFSTMILGSIILMICIMSYNFRNSRFLIEKGNAPTVANNFNLGSLEYTPARYVFYTFSFWERIDNRKGEISTRYPETEVSNYSHTQSNISFNIDTKNKIDSIVVPLFYYKGYTASFNKEQVPITENVMGLFEIPIKGNGFINVDFEGTFIQKYSFYMTLFMFIFLFFLCYLF